MSAVVLDWEYADALLGLAASEDLLEVTNRDFFEKKKVEQSDLTDSLLAAVVAHDRLILPMTDHYYNEIPIKGPLLDRLEITFLTREEEKNHLLDDEMLPLFSSQDSLVDYLRACRLNITGEALHHALSNTERLSAEFAKRFGSNNISWRRISDVISRTTGGKGTLSDEDLEFLASYDPVYDLLSGAEHHLRQLNAQIRRANQLNADILLSKPLGAKSSPGLGAAPIRGMSALETIDISTLDQSNLFQFIALNIGSIPYRGTLSDSAKLARTPEAEALRQRTKQLFDELHSGGTTDLAQLRKEIDLARRSMAGVERWSQISNVTTAIGVPLGALGLVSSDASLAGFDVSVIGAYALGRAWLGETGANNWVKFGKGDV